ncbi:MAG: prenyltransferase/squalene oxidase repeat-containing protein [Planctomycetota bacterium]|jgi:hypothetical protein
MLSRSVRFALPLLAAIALAPSVATAQDGEPANDPSAKLPERVNQAIDSGVEWLLQQTMVSGSFETAVQGKTIYGGGSGGDRFIHPTGCTSLALYTLLKCGVEPDHPKIKKAFAWLQKGNMGNTEKGNRPTPKNRPSCTYCISVQMLAIEARANPHKREKDRIREEKAKTRRSKKLNTGIKLKGREKKWMAGLASSLVKRLQRRSGWRYQFQLEKGKFHQAGDGSNIDMSATQLAMMGLLAAERCGIKQKDSLYIGVLKWVLKNQEKDGPEVERFDPMKRDTDDEYGKSAATMDRARGWGYFDTSGKGKEHQATGSMTACGLANLLICGQILDARGADAWRAGLKEKTEKAWQDGEAWLKHKWTMSNNPGKGGYHYYYLYCIERVGDLKGVSLLGGRPWYPEGAEVLVDAQTAYGEDRGAWTKDDTHSPHKLLNTCFALLFLNRSTPAITAD